jgi:hypothetical protein
VYRLAAANSGIGRTTVAIQRWGPSPCDGGGGPTVVPRKTSCAIALSGRLLGGSDSSQLSIRHRRWAGVPEGQLEQVSRVLPPVVGLDPLTAAADVLESSVAGAPTVTTGERCTMSQVQQTLAAWREAERQLKASDDPREIPALVAEVERLHQAYRQAVDVSAHDVSAHGEPTDHMGEPKV